MKRIIVVMISVVVAAICWNTIKADGEKILIMSEELVTLAENNGYEQLQNFYSKRPGTLEPCFVYGYFPYEGRVKKYNSAVFWCKRLEGGKEEYFIIIAKREHFRDMLSIDEVLLIPDFPRGLSVFKDTSLTLDQFVYLDNPKQKGPADQKMNSDGIRSIYDGAGTQLYKFEDKWLFRQFH